MGIIGKKYGNMVFKKVTASTLAAGDSEIGADEIASSAVTTAKLAANAVTTAKITDANVTADKLASNAVTTAKITDANVTAAKLASNAVTTAKITDANVTTAKLANSAVSFAKMNVASGTATIGTAETSIAHGLTGTPSAISITLSGTGGNVYRSSALDGTNIKLTAVGTENTVDWWAIV